MGTDNGFFLVLNGVKNSRHQIGQTFPDPGAGFNNKLIIILKGFSDSLSHALLLWTIFKILKPSQTTFR
jgi:hypothetical protein